MAADGISRTSGRQTLRRGRDTGPGRRRKRDGRHRPGLCGQRAHSGSSRRRHAEPTCRQTQFLGCRELPAASSSTWRRYTARKTSVRRCGRAFNALRNGPAGPVVVELTMDVCSKDIPEDALNYKSPRTSRQKPANSEIKDAVKALLAASNPLLWAGQGVLTSRAAEELKALAEVTGIPVFCTMPGKSAMDERHPLCLGAGSGATTMAAGKWLEDCDLILALGSSMTRTFYGQSVAGDRRYSFKTPTMRLTSTRMSQSTSVCSATQS